VIDIVVGTTVGAGISVPDCAGMIVIELVMTVMTDASVADAIVSPTEAVAASGPIFGRFVLATWGARLWGP
jgi:hypothetical protein